MRAPVKTCVFMVTWAVLLIVPWLIYVARGWELETDCDQVVRAPEGFGYWVALAAFVSLPFAIGSAVQEQRWIRAWCIRFSDLAGGDCGRAVRLTWDVIDTSGLCCAAVAGKYVRS